MANRSYTSVTPHRSWATVKIIPPLRHSTNPLYIRKITPDVLRFYKKFMVSEGYAGKTIDTRINIVNFLLKKNGIVARIPMPVVQVEAAVPFSEEDLKKLFAEMDEEETLRCKFFLHTGGRDREVTFASWADINFEKKTYTIRAKPEAGFFPKNHESRTVPLPDSLVVLLKKGQGNKKSHRWIFANKDGKPENHSQRPRCAFIDGAQSPGRISGFLRI